MAESELVGQKDGGHLDDFFGKNGDVFFWQDLKEHLKLLGRFGECFWARNMDFYF